MLKKLLTILLSACMLFSLAACANRAEPGGDPADTRLQVSGQKTIYYGDDNGEPLHNPLMGWQYYAFPWEIIRYGIPEQFDIGVIKCSWDQIEKAQGEYDFDLLDRAIDQLKKDGKTVYLRLYLMPDNVWDIAGYPAWVKDIEGVGEFKNVDFDNLNGNGAYSFAHPEYGNKVYQGLISTFLLEVSKHYKDGFVDIIDSRAYGLYGEWDSNWGNYWIADKTNPAYSEKYDPNFNDQKTRILNEIVNVYKDAFIDYSLTKIAINVSAEEFDTEEEMEAYYLQSAFDNALKAGFAVRFDGIGSAYSQKLFLNNILAKHFPTTPLFCETWFGWNTNFNVEATYDAFNTARSNGATYGFFKGNYQDALKYSSTFFEDGLKPNEDGKQIGYRIYPKQIEFNKEANCGGKISFESKWTNTGSGVLYRHYPLGLSLIDSKGDEVYFATREDFNLTTLIKGTDYTYSTTFNLPAADKLPAGEYTVKIALLDKSNNNKSAIAMPIGIGSELDYAIGKVTLK